MQTKILSTFTLIMLFSLASQAQDYIHKKNREILKVKIEDIGTDEIRFKDFDNPDGPTFSIEKEKVSKVELENGDEITMKKIDTFEDPDYYTDQSKNAIKWSFSGIMFNHLTFVYERSLTPSTSFEAGISAIGVGYSPSGDELGAYNLRNPAGVGFRGAYKFKRSPDYYIPKMRYGHILKGGYIKPELIMSIFGEDVNTYDKNNGFGYKTERQTAVSGALMINFGKQVVFADQFAVDFFFGIGYGFSTSENYNWESDENYRDTPATLMYGFLLVPEIPLAFSSGLTIGYVFGK